MRRFIPFLILLAVIVGYLQIFEEIWTCREEVRSATPAGYIIPSKFSRILAAGNKGLLSDFLFLKTATFIGGKNVSDEPLNDNDWQFVAMSLDVVTDLDPYFVDPYMLAEGLLAWDAGMPEEANRLLSKGMKYRMYDWRLPFFIGFNYFYFLQDYEIASGYIMSASQLPDSPDYLATLGARLAYYGGKTKTALLFLKEMLADADDPLLKKRLQLRLLALERAVLIENALHEFQRQEGRTAKNLDELVSAGYLDQVLPDPYGGDWIVLKNGRVFSTSKFAHPK